MKALEFVKVSVQWVVALGDQFATLCQELDLWSILSFIINFQKEKANTLTLLIILTVFKQNDPKYAGINLQSTQSATTPRRLTLEFVDQTEMKHIIADVQIEPDHRHKSVSNRTLIL